MKRIARYFRGVGKEAKRVRWPDSHTFVSSMIVVIVIVLFAGLFLALEDYASAVIISALRDAFSSMR